MKITNALIKSTMLGPEDHGLFTCYLYLEFPPGGQGFGGYCFDAPDPALVRAGAAECRVGTAYGMQFIMEILRTVGVGSWEKLPGTYIRVRHDSEGWNSPIAAIGHIIKDVWFEPAALGAKFGVRR